MRFLLPAVLAATLLSGSAEAAGEAYSITGLGQASCGTWTAARRDRQAIGYEQWVFGYLSGTGDMGVSFGLHIDPLNGVDAGAVNRPATDIQAVLTVIRRRVDLSGVDLSGVDLGGARLSGIDMRYANLNNANLSGADLRNTDLTSAILSGADLNGANLVNANLIDANLSRADLSRADLSIARLNGANLTGADLTEANLSGASLIGATLIGADLTAANLTFARLDSQDQLNQACGKPKALPDGLTLNKPCPLRPVAPPLNQKTTP